MKRFALIFSAAVLAIALAGCGKERPAPQAQQAPIAVTTAEVRRVSLDDTFDAPGTVRARNSAVISAKVTGYVQEIRVNVGDRVKAGQALAVLAAQDLDAQVARASAGQLAAQSGVQEAEKARLATQSNASLAAITYQRYQTLLEKRSVSRQEFDEAEARYKTANASQEMADATVARAQAAQRQAEAEVQAARVMRGYAVLSAPFAGVISEKRVDPGNLAMPGQPLFTVEQTGDFRLEATVEESRIGAVKLGDTATVTLEALSSTVNGRVSEIVPAVEATSRSFVVKIDLPARATSAGSPDGHSLKAMLPADGHSLKAMLPADGHSLKAMLPVDGHSLKAMPPADGHSLKAMLPELRSGLFGRATFRSGQRQAIAVPERSVLRDGQLASVFVVQAGVARQRLVTLGAKSGELIEVLSGLSEGDRLIVNRPPDLRDGAAITEVQGPRSKAQGQKESQIAESRRSATSARLLSEMRHRSDLGPWTLDLGPKPDLGPWTLDLGPNRRWA